MTATLEPNDQSEPGSNGLNSSLRAILLSALALVVCWFTISAIARFETPKRGIWTVTYHGPATKNASQPNSTPVH